MSQDPRSVGVPHDAWRPEQLDAYKKSKEILDKNNHGTFVVEAPTGIGKSAIATALGHDTSVTVLVHNHGLLEQYKSIYGFDIVKGKPEYACVLPSKVTHWMDVYGITPTAADCHFQRMYDCPFAGRCPYVIARETALASNRMACTYKYAALSEAVNNRDGVIVMDEVHDSYEELIEFAKFEMDDRTRADYKFGNFPLLEHGYHGEGDLLSSKDKSTVANWIVKSMQKISVVDLFSEMTQEGARNKRMFTHLSVALEMVVSDQPIFYKCTERQNDDWRFATRSVPRGAKMQIRSLDVKNLVSRMTDNFSLRLMMSATIGNPRPLMNELGFQNFVYREYPHPTPRNKRPVYNLHVDKMTKANLDGRPALYKAQANAIARFISKMPNEWRGIVLTSSNYKIGLLRTFLSQSLPGRVMIPPPDAGLKDQIHAFTSNTDPGKIVVGTIQGWGSGLSLEYDTARMSIVAGVPFSNPGDRFDQLRMSTPTGKRYAFWNAYASVVQATGRVTRGEQDDNGEYMLNVAAIADGSALTQQAKASYPNWFKEAIRD